MNEETLKKLEAVRAGVEARRRERERREEGERVVRMGVVAYLKNEVIPALCALYPEAGARGEFWLDGEEHWLAGMSTLRLNYGPPAPRASLEISYYKGKVVVPGLAQQGIRVLEDFLWEQAMLPARLDALEGVR